MQVQGLLPRRSLEDVRYSWGDFFKAVIWAGAGVGPQ